MCISSYDSPYIIYNFLLIEWMQNDKIVQKSVSHPKSYANYSVVCTLTPSTHVHCTLCMCAPVEFEFWLGDGELIAIFSGFFVISDDVFST